MISNRNRFGYAAFSFLSSMSLARTMTEEAGGPDDVEGDEGDADGGDDEGEGDEGGED